MSNIESRVGKIEGKLEDVDFVEMGKTLAGLQVFVEEHMENEEKEQKRTREEIRNVNTSIKELGENISKELRDVKGRVETLEEEHTFFKTVVTVLRRLSWIILLGLTAQFSEIGKLLKGHWPF